jgi:hypothetical protein
MRVLSVAEVSVCFADLSSASSSDFAILIAQARERLTHGQTDGTNDVDHGSVIARISSAGGFAREYRITPAGFASDSCYNRYNSKTSRYKTRSA